MIITCPNCERDIETRRGSLGRRVRCPLCGEAFVAELPVAVATEDDTPTLPLPDPFIPTRPKFRVMPTPPRKDDRAQPAEESAKAEQADTERDAPAPLAQARAVQEPPLHQAQPVPEAPLHQAQPVGEAPLPQAQPAPEPPNQPASLPTTCPAQPSRAPEGWFVKTKNGEVGPMHILQVAKAIGMGKIGPETLLRHSGRNITIFACCCVPGLFAKEAAEAAKATNSPRPENPNESAEPDPCDFLAQMAGSAAAKPAPAEKPAEKPAQTPAEDPAKQPAAESHEKPAQTGNSNLDELIQAHNDKAEEDAHKNDKPKKAKKPKPDAKPHPNTPDPRWAEKPIKNSA